jgi:hypothetical protein
MTNGVARWRQGVLGVVPHAGLSLDCVWLCAIYAILDHRDSNSSLRHLNRNHAEALALKSVIRLRSSGIHVVAVVILYNGHSRANEQRPLLSDRIASPA